MSDPAYINFALLPYYTQPSIYRKKKNDAIWSNINSDLGNFTSRVLTTACISSH